MKAYFSSFSELRGGEELRRVGEDGDSFHIVGPNSKSGRGSSIIDEADSFSVFSRLREHVLGMGCWSHPDTEILSSIRHNKIKPVRNVLSDDGTYVFNKWGVRGPDKGTMMHLPIPSFKPAAHWA